MVVKEIEVVANGDLILDQETLGAAGLGGSLRLIIQEKEIRILPDTMSVLEVERPLAEKRLDQIDREQQAYEAQHARILAIYAGQYIAMRRGQVVDHDTDRVALGQRVRARYGFEPILITPVRQEARQTMVVRSPRLLESVT